MPQGLEVLNEDGSVRNSVTDFFGKILGTKDYAGNAMGVAWPYPEIPAARRVLYCISNRSHNDDFPSYAWALFDNANNTTFSYDQYPDRAPITVMFMAF